MQNESFHNTLLQHLASETILRLQLRPVQLDLGKNLETPGTSIRNIVFVEQGIGSMTAVFKDGFEVEVGMFGYESVIGISALMGTKQSLNRVFVQMAGHGFSSPLAASLDEFGRSGDLHDLSLRYVQAQLIQAT